MPILNKRAKEQLSGIWLTPAEVAVLLQISEKTVIRHFVAKKLPAVKFGNKWRSPRKELDKLMSTS